MIFPKTDNGLSHMLTISLLICNLKYNFYIDKRRGSVHHGLNNRGILRRDTEGVKTLKILVPKISDVVE